MRFILAILIVFFSTNCFAFWTKGTDTAPEVQTFCKRVLDDGGTVVDVEYMDKTVKLLKQLGVWNNVKFLGDANFAVKLNGSGVTKFYDLSGNNNDATQGTVANQPVWTKNVQGGRYGIVFDGTDDFFQITADGSALFNFQSYTLLSTIKHTNQAVAAVLWSYDFTSQIDPYYAQNLRLSPVGSIFMGWNHSGVFKNLESATGDITQGTFYLVSAYNSSGDQKIYLNGTQKATSTVSGTITYYAQEVWIGRFNQAVSGSIAEGGLMVFNTVLTTAQRTAIEKFVNSYYSIY